MTRQYVLKARAASAERTRREILDAAREHLLGAEGLDFSVGEVAAAAGVARSTIYAAFGSRAGLLAALTEDALVGAGLAEVISEYQRPGVVEAIEGSLRANCRMYGADHRLMARLLVLAEVDPEAAGPIARFEKERAAGMADLADRLANQGRLRPGVDVEHAAHVLSLLTSFHAFDELHARRGLEPDACATVLVAIARAAVIA